MESFKNFNSPLRRRARKNHPDDKGFLLNETAIWLVVIGIILGLGGYFGLRFISQTQSAAARQGLDRAVAVADSVYSQQIDGRVSFLGGAAVVTTPTMKDQAWHKAQGDKVAAEWNIAGEGLKFVWWAGVDPDTANGTNGTWHDELLAVSDPDVVWLYVNLEDVTGEFDGDSNKKETIPAGQLLRLATADEDDNTYCVVYIRQIRAGNPNNTAAIQKHIGTGYQSIRKASPAAKSSGDDDNKLYADCGMEGQFDASSNPAGVLKAADPFDTKDIPGDGSSAELPGVTQTTSARLSDPSNR